MLSFLLAQCTRPGGSYWVLKEPNSDFIRVFDLKALGEGLGEVDEDRESSQEQGRPAGGSSNPFARAVGLMSFRMAQKPHSAALDLPQRKRLLLQCVELLP